MIFQQKIKKMKENIKKYLKKLEKRKIISKKPNPLIPFIIAIFFIILTIISQSINKLISNISLVLFIFTIIFAIIHLIIVKILKK